MTTIHLHGGGQVAVTETPQEVASKIVAAHATGEELLIFTSPDRLAAPVKVAEIAYAEERA